MKKLNAWCILLVLFASPLALNGAETNPPSRQKAIQTPDPITGAEPAEGFGVNQGGLGGEEVVVTTFAELGKAVNRNNVYIKVKGDIVATGTTLGKGSNITIDGGGTATLWGSAHDAFERQLELYGKNIVIKDIHFRNSGDNLGFKAPAENILISHVTTSGSLDDGMSIAYGTKNVTVQYCAFFGNTRNCFIKYKDPQNISMHHNWFKAQYMRGPLISTAHNVDIRNQVGEDWWTWGGPRFEMGSTGNCVNSVFVMTGATPGKKDAACYTYMKGGPAYFDGNLFRGCSGRPGNSVKEIPCAPVTTQSAEDAEKTVRASAGCLPRDEIDQAYIAMKKWGPMNTRMPVIFKLGPASPMSQSPLTSMQVPNDKEDAGKKKKGAGKKKGAVEQNSAAEK